MAKLDSPPSVGDPFSIPAVYAYWKEFDLDGRRSKLDEVSGHAGTAGHQP